MKLIIKLLVIFIITALTLVVLWKKQAPVDQSKQEPAPVYKSQEQKSGDIIMTITPKILAAQKPPSFEVILDTHSVDLAFDVASSSSLTDVSKQTYGNAIWDGDPPGGHHRKGILTFSDSLQETADVVTLSLVDIADTDWEFQWTL